MAQRDPEEESSDGQVERLGERGHRPSRRRFGKAALGGIPALLTLRSQPLRAAGNCSISGFASANSGESETESCGGRGSEYWSGSLSKQDFPEWARNQNEPVDSEYGFPELVNAGNITLQEAVEGAASELLRAGTAALLNAKFILGYTLTEEEVREIVTVTQRDGVYVTSAGDELTTSQVTAFFENTFDF
ncbi:hypothetical protein [Halorhodospira neutriphila]|uniref:Uncharacterized protein n=1 Tax=Halorhodospira neutriphila TaxID=168379 RepID=A0ABS1E7I5_9GAMM|nr:hypothetical protein [Halorhodospira neutriphila]MBK1727475.1 hypothetical protein [Halorhodospira neutriphila]